MRAPILAVLALAAAAPLAACGFTPLYATPGVTGGLAGVAVDPPEHSRTGFLLSQKLDDEFGRKNGVEPTYRLGIAVREYRVPKGVRVNNVANRYEIDLNASFTLTDAATGRVLLTGSAPVQVSYDSADAPYAGVAAAADGEERAAEQAAVLIRLQVSRWLAANPRGAAAAAQAAAG
ncbi:MAG: hypothetical protein INR64_04290 [Caulobacteraceae bacterium]|nr:hypothetical protein [Caulobacter sp.]